MSGLREGDPQAAAVHQTPSTRQESEKESFRLIIRTCTE